ncbi:OmpH family outer membrane protein [Aquimarina sp. MMG016]|uniref:OmpH family outer membrane protein n=1 Tax=Aquimarina sp. MMG016 TaxID=2822690 RepID=UPI001B3A688E|nr:OmpH family outer membrane protein [Aquimarina sp. MMG016]MBQ4822625.1 OmpH family outer membrane protein [Aquimarina sp. MMG016]
MKKIIVALLVLISSFSLTAQTKTGTIDSEFILSKMPELTKVEEDLKAYNKKLEDELKIKVDDYQAKVKDYQEKVATMTEPMKKTKQEEIINLENDIAKFRQNGSQLVQIEQNRLLQPLYQKIGKTLEEVAKAEGYSQVFTITTSGLAFIDPKYDLTKTVISKLGIKLEEGK